VRQQFRSLNYDPDALFVADITWVERDVFCADPDLLFEWLRRLLRFYSASIGPVSQFICFSGVTPFWWSLKSIFGEIVVTKLKRARHHFSKRSAARPICASALMSLVAKAASTSKSWTCRFDRAPETFAKAKANGALIREGATTVTESNRFVRLYQIKIGKIAKEKDAWWMMRLMPVGFRGT